MARKNKKSFDAAAAYAAAPDDDSMGQEAGGSAPAGADPTGAAQGAPPTGATGQDLTIPAQVVGQLEQLKQTGDFQSLGQAVAQLLP